MLKELKNNLQAIYNDVIMYLKPDNLKRDISLLNVDGFLKQGNKYKKQTTVGITNVNITTAPGATYGFNLNSSGYYESTNKAQSSSAAVCRINFTAVGKTTLTISYINFAESSYDFGMFSKLDTALSIESTEDAAANLELNLKGKQSATVNTVTYRVSKGEHFIDVKFKKDGSVDKDNDSLQFRITDLGTCTKISNEVVAVAYYTAEEMMADTNQTIGTMAVVITENNIAQAVYRLNENLDWELKADLTKQAPLTFATIEEMNANTDYPENTFAIVYGTTYVGTYRFDKGSWTQIGDSTDEQIIMDTLNEVVGSPDEYEGVGGTDEEINSVLDQIIGGNE